MKIILISGQRRFSYFFTLSSSIYYLLQLIITICLLQHHYYLHQLIIIICLLQHHFYLMKEYSPNNNFHKFLKTQPEQPIQLATHEHAHQDKINNIINQAQSFFQNEDSEAAIIKLKLALERINCLKQNRRDYDKKIELVCLYNLAATYQKQWNLDQCIPLLQKCCNMLKSFLQQPTKSADPLVQPEYQNKHWFKMKSLLIKSQLQYCAVLSQIGQHKKALKVAIEITNEVRVLFKKSCEYCSLLIARREAEVVNAKSRSQRKEQKWFASDKIEFSLNVLINANKILHELSNIWTYSQLFGCAEVESEMKQVKQKLYYWKDNPQNNIKMIRQTFNNENFATPASNRTPSHRNLLGIKRNSNSWIEDFTISKIMFMTYITYGELSDPDNLIFEFNHRNIMEKVIYLSVSYFSLSIELRFLEQDDHEKHSKREESNVNKKNRHKDLRLGEKEAILKIEEGKSLRMSEIFHLKSIEVVCKYIQENSAFVNHLVLNYHKHYKLSLNTIQEENSLAEYSQLYEINRQASFQHPNILHRKDSIYFQWQPNTLTSEEQVVAKLQNSTSLLSAFKKGSEKKICQLGKDEDARQSKKAIDERERSRMLFNSTQLLDGLKDKTMKKVNNSKMVTLKYHQVKQLVDKSQKSLSSRNQSHVKARDKSNLSKSKQFLKNFITLKQNKSQSPLKEKPSKKKLLLHLKDSQQYSRQDLSIKKSTSHHALDLLKKSGSLNEMKQKDWHKQTGQPGSAIKKK